MLGGGLAHGMYNPATVWSSDTGLYFDGVNDNALAIFPNEILNGFTISMWVKTPNETYSNNAGDPNAAIFGLRRGIGKSSGPFLTAYYKDDGTDRININRTNAGNTGINEVYGTFDDDDWEADFHLVVSVTPAQIVGYINGSAFTTNQAGSSGDWDVEEGNYYLHFGHLNPASGASISFSEYHIHDINIWQGVLGSGEVASVYNNGEPKDETNSAYGTFDSNNNFAGVATTTALINGYEPS